MAKNDLGFAPNYSSALEINITPGESTKTWAILSRGITEIKPTPNESTEDKDYYENCGVPETKVKSTQIQYEVTGDRYYGDPAQDFVASLALEIGDGRKTDFRHTDPNGDVVEGECTILNIVVGSQQGAASDPGAFSCTVATAGRPTYTEASKNKLPTSVTAKLSGTSVAVGKSSAITATVTPTDANPKCFYASSDNDVATVDSEGNVTGVAAGKATVTVRAASKPSVFATVEVTVSAS